jgi:hypothetical protein
MITNLAFTFFANNRYLYIQLYMFVNNESNAHFLFRTGLLPPASIRRRLLTGYAVSFNRRHKRHGHLFQNRYKSTACQEDAHLKELVCYIHLNPVRAGMVFRGQGIECLPILWAQRPYGKESQSVAGCGLCPGIFWHNGCSGEEGLPEFHRTGYRLGTP